MRFGRRRFLSNPNNKPEVVKIIIDFRKWFLFFDFNPKEEMNCWLTREVTFERFHMYLVEVGKIWEKSSPVKS